MNYHDFTIDFLPGREGGALVRVSKSMAGEGRFERFEPPAVEEDLHVVARAAEARAEAERSGWVGADLGNLEKLSAAALRSLGARLFERLFRGSVRSRFDESLGLVAPSGDGLRIKIQLDLNEPDLVPLSGLPWELLADGATDHSLGLDRRSSIVRYIPQRRPLDRRELPRPLRILLASAEPPGSQPLALDREIERVREAVERPGEIEVRTLAHATLGSLRRALTGPEEIHVLHFMGHGEFDPESGEGVLYLEDGNGSTAIVRGGPIADQLRDRTALRLVFLNACRTARSAAPSPFGGVATALVRAGVPAVIAMQFPMVDSAAIAFSETVYGRLAAGDPIDAAVTEGRLAVHAAAPKLLAWGTPVLFSHVADGRLFWREGEVRPRKPVALPFSSLGPLFHGREDMLTLLRERLKAAPAGRATAIAGKAVHGLGGVGKTRLTVEYAWKYAEKYSALLFVGAGSPADLRRNLAALSAKEVLDLPGREATEEEVREAAIVRWLGDAPGWLLILDNVDSEDAAVAVDALVARLH
ncbi:MAG TPA: CHAT domain-containing protein, partial [Thermoanaerobaculia bacterium]|nr:CHAT domain-containing protein [Thermoanaerobaculia bacterium]